MKKILIIFYFSFCLCITAFSQTNINGWYESPHPSFWCTKIRLHHEKFRMITTGDAGKSKGHGHYKINWNDSTISFNFKRAKSKRYGRIYKKVKEKESLNYKINSTKEFSFGNFRRKIILPFY